jgi:hypothetical protein
VPSAKSCKTGNDPPHFGVAPIVHRLNFRASCATITSPLPSPRRPVLRHLNSGQGGSHLKYVRPPPLRRGKILRRCLLMKDLALKITTSFFLKAGKPLLKQAFNERGPDTSRDSSRQRSISSETPFSPFMMEALSRSSGVCHTRHYIFIPSAGPNTRILFVLDGVA